ncbi:hypothetical protein ACIHFD_54700 [Nonomuraea sp. NPDC051941]|uniref:hypothetical protein n=1 Tax=Nonomuraea sp. NPDC051941 TaxID=3364373 RepID=UPI0037CA359C
MLHLVALLALGVVLLAVAGDFLVSGAGRLAARLGLRPIVVGAVITGIAASVSTLIVASLASLRGYEELAAAGLAGANIVNLTVVLGVGGLVAELRISSALLPRQALLSTAAVTIFALMLLGRLTWGASAPWSWP